MSEIIILSVRIKYPSLLTFCCCTLHPAFANCKLLPASWSVLCIHNGCGMAIWDPVQPIVTFYGWSHGSSQGRLVEELKAAKGCQMKNFPVETEEGPVHMGYLRFLDHTSHQCNPATCIFCNTPPIKSRKLLIHMGCH